MKQRNRSNLAFGLVLILVGAAFLAVQLFPGLQGLFDVSQNWPLIIIGAGVLMLLLGAVSGAPGMAVPASIVAGIGGILFWQNATGNWESWSYVWALIPGFVGIGVILNGVLSGQARQGLQDGGRTILVSLVMFAIFGAFFGRELFAGWVWPGLLILAGFLILLSNFIRPRAG
jgi:hypothetical protein